MKENLNKQIRLVADFETLATNEHNYTYVWGWGVVEVENLERAFYGNNIESFFKVIEEQYKNKEVEIYFHNLKFDGSFILNHLFRKGYKHVPKLKKGGSMEVASLISELGEYYFIEFYNGSTRVKILNSLNLIRLSVAQIAKGLGLPLEKGEIDYTKYRSENHTLTEEERDYIANDIKIVAIAIKSLFFDKRLNKMTVGSNALAYFKYLHNFNCRYKGIESYDDLFPRLSLADDTAIRRAYRGGITMTAGLKEVIVAEGSTYDFNSMYPSIMLLHPLPVGYPEKFLGKPTRENTYFTVRMICKFKLKNGGIPFIQIKNDLRFSPNEILTTSEGLYVDITLTSFDLIMFIRHYHIEVKEYVGGYYFQVARGLYDEYINYFADLKIKAGREGDKASYMYSKIMMNSLTGKFATSPVADVKIPFLVDGVLRFRQEESTKPLEYLPTTVFITALARFELLKTIERNHSNFCYCDTDSVHLKKGEVNIKNIDPLKFGCWKQEYEFKRAKFLKAKCYFEETENGNIIKVAGLQEKYKTDISFEEFNVGLTVEVLKPRQVEGGVKLIKTPFEIK